MDLLLVDLTVLVVAQRRPGPVEPVAGMFGGIGAKPGPHLAVGIIRGLSLREAAVGGAGQYAAQFPPHAQRSSNSDVNSPRTTRAGEIVNTCGLD